MNESTVYCDTYEWIMNYIFDIWILRYVTRVTTTSTRRNNPILNSNIWYFSLFSHLRSPQCYFSFLCCTKNFRKDTQKKCTNQRTKKTEFMRSNICSGIHWTFSFLLFHIIRKYLMLPTEMINICSSFLLLLDMWLKFDWNEEIQIDLIFNTIYELIQAINHQKRNQHFS